MSRLSVIRRSRPVTGLDVTADRVTAAMLEPTGELRTAARPLPPGLVDEGEVLDAGALAAELRALFAEHDLSKSVRIGLASPRIVVRRLELPAVLKGSDLDAAVRFQAADVFPGGLDTVVFDHRALDPEGDKRRVILAAARRDIVERWGDAIELAGLRLEGIDLAGFALARELAAEVDPDPSHGTLLVHLGDVVTMAIVEGGAAVFARATAPGADPAAEARSTLDFHAGAAGAQALGRVVLSGTAEDWEATEAAFQSQLGAPVHRDRTDSGERDRLLIASGLARLDPSRVGVDLRPEHTGERGRRSDPAARGRRILVPAVAAAIALFAAGSALYVQASNTAAARADDASRLEARATAVEQQATALTPYEDLASLRADREGAVRQIAGSRLDWSTILRDIARLTPGDVDLVTLRATVAPAVSSGGTAAGAGAGGGSLRGARTTPAVELNGCAASHPGVSRMLGQMGRVRGVTLVALSNSARLSRQGTSGSGGGGVDCRRGDKRRSMFSMVLFLENAKPILPPSAGGAVPAAPAAAAAAAATATPSTTSGSHK